MTASAQRLEVAVLILATAFSWEDMVGFQGIRWASGKSDALPRTFAMFGMELPVKAHSAEWVPCPPVSTQSIPV